MLEEILRPGASLNPDFVSSVVELRDGRQLTGIVFREKDGRVRVVDTEARAEVVEEAVIRELRASGTSLMPDGYGALGDEKLADLVAFLTAPPPRGRAAVEAALGPERAAAPAPRPLEIVLVTGPKDHGPGEHDYPAFLAEWTALLGRLPAVHVGAAFRAPGAGDFERASLIVLYSMDGAFWSGERLRAVDAFLERGGGLALLHSAVIADDPDALAARTGLAAPARSLRFRHGPLTLRSAATRSPLLRGLPAALTLTDETYWPLSGDESRVEVLATAEEEGRARPMAWTFRRGRGRVFASVLGHYTATLDDPLVRVLLLRGMAWAAGEAPERFERLALEGLAPGR